MGKKKIKIIAVSLLKGWGKRKRGKLVQKPNKNIKEGTRFST